MCPGFTDQDTVDVGVGLIPVGDRYCTMCDWVEGGPLVPQLTMEERPSAPAEVFLPIAEQ
jgi:hypothetical protein